jgi:Protein of unknown function (DUF3307)
VSWVELFAVLAVCHMVGDFVVQTNWQAAHKRGGLGGDRDARRALASHIATYTLTFVPALVWIGDVRGAGAAVGVAAAIAFPHLIQDDGRLLRSYMRSVKHVDPDDQLVAVLVDQACHAVVLLVTALIVAS